MTFLAWVGLTGAFLLLMALSSAYVRRLPFTTASVYLVIGVVLSPVGLDLVRLDFAARSEILEHVTEIGVIVSLFIGGLKLRLPLRNQAWWTAYLLAAPVMVVCIGAVAAVGHFGLGFDWPLAVLIGAVLAPTDPVLASAVTVENSADCDRMRYGVSGEAGFNDGAAFPFVIFALLWADHGTLGSWVGEWALHRLVWAVPAGLVLGFFLAKGVGQLAIWLRVRHRESDAPEDFLAMALIALAYFGAETVGAWGFLSVFAAGLGFRRAEVRMVQKHPVEGETASTSGPHEHPHPPAETLLEGKSADEAVEHPGRAAGVVVSQVVSFGDTAERLLEVVLVVLLGLCLEAYWDWRAIPVALALFLVIRPLATLLFLYRTPSTVPQRLLIGWFGIRGIGSLYYLAYALNHGWSEQVPAAVGVTLGVVALSIIVHGLSVQPLLAYYTSRWMDSSDPETDDQSRGVPPSEHDRPARSDGRQPAVSSLQNAEMEKPTSAAGNEPRAKYVPPRL